MSGVPSAHRCSLVNKPADLDDAATMANGTHMPWRWVWLIVAIPLGWGLYQSLMKSKPLFAAPVAQNAPAKAANK